MESVGCAGVYLAVPGMLSLFATGRTSGLVLDAGHEQTTIVPVFQVGPNHFSLNSFAFYISSSYLRGNQIHILDILLVHLSCKMLPLEIECLF